MKPTRSLTDRVVTVAKDEPHLLHLEAWDALGHVIVALADELNAARECARAESKERHHIEARLAVVEEDRDAARRERDELVALLRRAVSRLTFADEVLREENEGPYEEEETFAADICDIHVTLAKYAKGDGK